MNVAGNKNLRKLTAKNGRSYQLRVDLLDWQNNARYAEYSAFWVESLDDQYEMEFDAFLGGDAGNTSGGGSKRLKIR